MQLEIELVRQINIFRRRGPNWVSVHWHFSELSGLQVFGREQQESYSPDRAWLGPSLAGSGYRELVNGGCTWTKS